MRRCAILTVAMGYQFEDVRPFLDSLRQAGCRDRVVMFTSHVDHETLGRLRSAGVEVVPFLYRYRLAHNSWSRFHRRAKFLLRTSPRAVTHRLYRVICELLVARFFLFRDFLERHREIERVLLTDLGDVLFQADPFACEWRDGVHVFLEEESVRIGNCPFNSAWIRDLFDEETLEAIRDKPISCAGTIMGNRAAVLRYLALFIGGLDRVRRMRYDGSDQGLHNFLLHTSGFGEFVVHPNHEWVSTLGHVPPAAIRVNVHDEVVGADGAAVPILHQYNRQPRLAPRLLARFPPPC